MSTEATRFPPDEAGEKLAGVLADVRARADGRLFDDRFTIFPDSGVTELNCFRCYANTGTWKVGYHPSLDVLIEQAHAHNLMVHGEEPGDDTLQLPSAAALRAYLTRKGWHQAEGRRTAGFLWIAEFTSRAVGVRDEDDPFLLRAAIDRIAQAERRSPGDVTRDILAAWKAPESPEGASPADDSREAPGSSESGTQGHREPCRGFRWIGQPLSTCDGCGKPAWEHEGEWRLREGASLCDAAFSDDAWEVRPWKPGEAEAIRRKWS